MKFDITNTKDFKQVNNALESVQKDLADHQTTEKQLRKKVDDVSEELADARVDFATQSITRKQLDKVIEKHEAAQQTLVRHGKNQETLRSAISKLKQKKQQVFDGKVQELQPKAEQEMAKKFKKLISAAEEFKKALTDAQKFADTSHREYNLPNFNVRFKPVFAHSFVRAGLSNFIERCQQWINNHNNK